MSSARALLICISLAACADDGTATGANATTSTTGVDTRGTTGTSTSSGSAVTDASSGDAPTGGAPTGTGAAESSTGEPGFDPPTPTCGNGYVEAMEECDDGNRLDGDDCDAACQVPCGLELELLELAPTAQSAITGVAVVAAPDGGFVVIGRVREITVDQEQQTTAGPREILVTAYDVAGAPRWQKRVGDAMGDLTASGGAVDATGDVFVIGSVDGADASDIWIGKLAADDGAELWIRVTDGALPGGDDFGSAIAVSGANEVVAVGQVRDKLNDSDVWVRKLAADDGATVWTTTWSGVPDAGYSLDSGSAVAAAPGGEIHVLAREYIDVDTSEATLLTFGPGGGAPLATASPLADGGKHKHNPGPLAVGPDGEVVLGVTRGGFVPTFWLFRLAPGGGAATWSLLAEDFITTGSDWSLTGIGIFPDGSLVLGGSWVDDVSQRDSAWVEVWTARLDARGHKRCQVSYGAPGVDFVPPSVVANSVAAGADGAALATGERTENDESSLWMGRFRPL